MKIIETITDKASELIPEKHDIRSHVSLNKATYVELFFDLVFIFCMRSILPIITDVEGGEVDWYSYYTFFFTFALMLQIWFNSTIFMNRFGTGKLPDILFLFVNMFLLFVMTRAIDTAWTHYAIYNVCWILITVNTMAHWLYRYSRIANPTPQVKRDTKRAIIVLALQAFLVLISHVMPKDPAQITCLVGLLLGFAFWHAGGKDRLDEDNQEHLGERCALLMVLTFGETLIGFGNQVTTDLNLFGPVMYFLLIVGMFLVYLNEIINLLDLHLLRGGRRYMAISAWMTFCVANVTAGFEMSMKGMTLIGLDADLYFGISVALFLLSFFLFMPFNKYGRPPRRWIAARIIACVLVLSQTSLAMGGAQWMLQLMGTDAATAAFLVAQTAPALTVVVVVAVYAILLIDRIAVRNARKRDAAVSPAEQ